ncbi:MAG: adenylyltransferase/cytidyltransferase family protein [Solirubrobacteraceae bacterium]
MIVRSDELDRVQGNVTMVSGGFDPLHDGHIAYFTEAARLGAPLLCNVTGDAYVTRKHPPLLDQDQRTRVIDALGAVAYTHVSSLATHEVIALARPRSFAKGRDWEGRLPREEIEACERAGTTIIYLDTVLASSTDLLDDCLERYAATRQ